MRYVNSAQFLGKYLETQRMFPMDRQLALSTFLGNFCNFEIISGMISTTCMMHNSSLANLLPEAKFMPLNEAGRKELTPCYKCIHIFRSMYVNVCIIACPAISAHSGKHNNLH